MCWSCRGAQPIGAVTETTLRDPSSWPPHCLLCPVVFVTAALHLLFCLFSWKSVPFMLSIFTRHKATAVLTMPAVVPSSIADVSYRKHGRKAGEFQCLEARGQWDDPVNAIHVQLPSPTKCSAWDPPAQGQGALHLQVTTWTYYINNSLSKFPHHFHIHDCAFITDWFF